MIFFKCPHGHSEYAIVLPTRRIKRKKTEELFGETVSNFLRENGLHPMRFPTGSERFYAMRVPVSCLYT